jgi:hypothetical protein
MTDPLLHAPRALLSAFSAVCRGRPRGGDGACRKTLPGSARVVAKLDSGFAGSAKHKAQSSKLKGLAEPQKPQRSGTADWQYLTRNFML